MIQDQALKSQVDALLAKRAANLKALRGTEFSDLREELAGSFQDLCPGVRWWRGPTMELVRVRDGDAWLIMPKNFAKFPPIFANAWRNETATVTMHLVEAGGAVILAEEKMGKAFELRLVAARH